MRLVLVGPPGAGKGTQAEFIAERFGVPKISTGDIFRANVSGGTDFGRLVKGYMNDGDLVPDEVTNAMVRARLAEPDCATGFLLDGFPRNVSQAIELDQILNAAGTPLGVVLDLQINHDEVVRRLSGRRTCRDCAHAWHIDYGHPAVVGLCNRCGGELYQRDDDQPATVRHRLRVYSEQTQPLIDFYRSRKQLVAIDALGLVEDVTERAIVTLVPFATR